MVLHEPSGLTCPIKCKTLVGGGLLPPAGQDWLLGLELPPEPDSQAVEITDVMRQGVPRLVNFTRPGG